ncbi:MAG: hypothetical protein AVDCRST_MAG18-4937, partial [uncultured Thermomicrobiales bacterium]
AATRQWPAAARPRLYAAAPAGADVPGGGRRGGRRHDRRAGGVGPTPRSPLGQSQHDRRPHLDDQRKAHPGVWRRAGGRPHALHAQRVGAQAEGAGAPRPREGQGGDARPVDDRQLEPQPPEGARPRGREGLDHRGRQTRHLAEGVREGEAEPHHVPERGGGAARPHDRCLGGGGWRPGVGAGSQRRGPLPVARLHRARHHDRHTGGRGTGVDPAPSGRLQDGGRPGDHQHSDPRRSGEVQNRAHGDRLHERRVRRLPSAARPPALAAGALALRGDQCEGRAPFRHTEHRPVPRLLAPLQAAARGCRPGDRDRHPGRPEDRHGIRSLQRAPLLRHAGGPARMGLRAAGEADGHLR